MRRDPTLREIEDMLKDLPKPDFDRLCDFLGITSYEIDILKLRYRSSNMYTREYVAEEVGVSPSTLDRRVKVILRRVVKYYDRLRDYIIT